MTTKPVGTFIRYSQATLKAKKMALVDQLAPIVESYEAAGYVVSVRQMYYQMVARGLMPNGSGSYEDVQQALLDGRMVGLISWSAFEDRGRSLRGLSHQTSVPAALSRLRQGYIRDLWAEQYWRPEVWCEKDALMDVVGRICNRLRVDYFSQHGYNSQTSAWEAGQRFAGYVRDGQRPIVLHIGDHDPSGVDMTRDNRERLALFAGVPITVQRLALNMSQVEELSLPPFWAKVTDSRSAGYIAQYGNQSWELDALPPPYIERVIEDAVGRLRDPVRWDASLARENEDQRELEEMIASSG